jgi:GT2 family glycosyltransferase
VPAAPDRAVAAGPPTGAVAGRPGPPPACRPAATRRSRAIGLSIVRPGEAPAAADYLIPLAAGEEVDDEALDVVAAALHEAGRPALLRGDPAGGNLPDFSPELMLATMEPPWALAVRADAFAAAGGWRRGFEGRAAIYDLALRLTDDPATRIAHAPVPVARRVPPTLARREAEAAQGARAVADALDRRGIDARVRRPAFALREGRPLFELDFPDDGPRVAVVVPTRDRVDLLRRCVGSILARTAYRNFRLVVVDDRGADPSAIAYLEALPGVDRRCRVIRRADDGRPFSYARLNNEAVRGLGDDGAEFVLFLNNDTQAVRPGWLSALVGYGRMPGVGAVGARLLYPDGRVQHAGVALGLHGDMPGHASKLAPWWDRGPSALASLARGCSAVTAACLLTRRATFLELGGFDEARFAVGYNDIDYCLRLRDRGLRTVYAPSAELLHFEGATRGHSDDPAETAAFLAAWGHLRDAPS